MLKKKVPSPICDPSVNKVVLVTTNRTNSRESKAPKLTALQRKSAYAAKANPHTNRIPEIKSPISRVTLSLSLVSIGFAGKNPMETASTRVSNAHAIASKPTMINKDANNNV